MILNLADNIMSSIPENLPRALKVLDLSRNLITNINNELERSRSLQVLNLQQNKLKLFRKDAFRGIRSLNKLIVASNYIHFLPGMFEPLQNLTHLDLSGNRLRSINLPKIHFRPLSSLKFLNLADNQCAILKENMFTHLTSLVSLHLERNNLSSVVSKYGRQLQFAGLNRLEELYITSNNITTLPEEFLKNQTSLKTLQADHNKIGSLGPKLFKYTKKLERLNLKHNKISFIGSESKRKAMNRNWCNQKANPALNTKAGNK